MKHLNICLLALFSLILVPSAHAALQPGKVQALIIIGKVELVSSTGDRKPLAKGDTFEEGNIVAAGPSSGATLVFSNGATMRVKENAQLAVTKFEQEPYDTTKDGEFIRLQADPSQSQTELDLRNGTLQGEVKKLNTAQKSTFNIHTPAGSAGIRGTIVSITVTRDAAGNVTGISATCATGSISFTPASGAAATATAGGGNSTTITNSNVTVDQGATVQISLQVNSAGVPTGVQVTGATANAATTAQVQQQVQQLFDAINTIRATSGLPPVPAPTVASTSTITTGSGAAVSSTTTATIDAPTAPITNIIPASTSSTNSSNPSGTASTGPANTATTATTASTASTGGTGNPTVPVSPQ